jgi:putative transposase
VLIKNGIAISMHGKGAWRDNIFVERLWRSIKYEEVYLRGYDSVSDLALRSANTSRFTTVGGPTRALTAKHPIKLTSPRCYSAWQLTAADVPLIDAEKLFRQPRPPQIKTVPARLILAW